MPTLETIAQGADALGFLSNEVHRTVTSPIVRASCARSIMVLQEALEDIEDMELTRGWRENVRIGCDAELLRLTAANSP